MRSRLALVIAAVLALAPLQVARADWKRDYDLGVKAIENGNWAEAETLMRSAIAQEPRAESRKRFQGTVWKPYVPHHYAGVAAWKLGRCEQALQYWRDRSNTSAIADLDRLGSEQSSGVSECTRRLAATSSPPATTTASTATAATTPAPTTSRPAPPTTTPSNTAPSTQPTASTTRPTPTQVASTPASTQTAPAKPVPPPPKASPAPEALVQAVENYLGGRYDAVLRLDPTALADGRSRAQGFLLRAAARYTLAELGDDARARQQAQQDVRAARAANASLAPDAVLFSPRFRAFWSGTR